MDATQFPRKHRWSRWMSAWSALSVPGLLLAMIAWGPGTTVALAAVPSFPIGLALILLKYGPEPRLAHPTGAGWASRVVLCAVSLFISTAVIAVTVPGLALLMVLVAIATAPPMVDLWRRMLGHTDSAHMHPASAEATARERPAPRQPPVETARSMTNRQLCQAWRRSYWTLKDARDPIERLRLVEQRTGLLDELEARNAEALGAWLDSGARACDGPDEFFDGDGRDQPTAA